MDVLKSIGLMVRSVVLDFAGTLREDYAPGVISLALVLLLIVALVLFALRIQSRVGALRWLDRKVRRHQDDREFSAALDRLNAEISTAGRGGAQAAVAGTWREFAETLIVQHEDGVPVYHNSVRPSAFFNLDDLGFGAGFWRYVPGLFVSVGLFLTFLGLVSALNAMVAESGGNIGPKQMNDLLSVASAKFIMSLTGLLCSIIFTIALRVGLHEAETAAHRLADGIEARLAFLSLEALAAKQLLAITEQREVLRALGQELVADLARPLRDMPGLVARSLEQTLRPLLDQVGRAGTDGPGAMTTREAGGAVSAGADQLVGVMTRTLEEIRTTTSAGTEALAAAAAGLREAGEGFGRQIETAGRMGADAASQVLGPLDAIAEKLDAVTRQVADAGHDMRLFAEGVKSGADASMLAATAMRDASTDLSAVAAPIQSSIASMETSIAALADATQTAAATMTRSAKATAKSAADALASAQAMLASERQAIDTALGGMSLALERLDERGVAGAADGIGRPLQDLQQSLHPGTDTQNAIVETATPSVPKQSAPKQSVPKARTR